MNKEIEVALRSLALVVLAAIPFVVLIVIDGTFFPYITGKNFAFRILVELATALWLILVLFKPAEYAPKKTHIIYSLGVFILIAGASTLLGANPYHSFWSNYERMEGYLGLLHCFAYFLVLVSLLKEERYWRWFFNLSITGAILVSLYGLRQHFFGVGVSGQGGDRIDGTFGNAIYLAGYATFHFFLSLYLANKTSNNILRVLYGLFAALFVYVVVLTQTRGAVLGLIAGAIVTLLLGLFRFSGKAKAVCGSILVVLLLVVGGLYVSRNQPVIKNHPLLTRLVSISPTEGTGKARLMIWGMALEGVKERPFFGWGQENFNLVFNKYYNPQMYAQEQWFDRAHSVIVDWLVAAGILGLLAYLSLYLFSFYHLLRPGSIFGKIESIFLTALLVGNFVQNVFVFDNLGGYLTFFMIIGYLHFRLAHAEAANLTNNSLNKKPVNIPILLSVFGTVIILIGLVFAIRYFNYLPIKQNLALINAISLQNTPSLKNNLEYFNEALSYGTFGDTETREQMLQGVFSVVTANQFPQEERVAYLNLTAKQMEEQIKLTPGDARYQFFYGALLRMFAKSEVALPYLNKAIELSPKKQSMLFEKASALIDLGNFQEAVQTAKFALEVAPQYHQAQVFYILALLYDSKINEIEKFVMDSEYPDVLLDEKLPPQFAKFGLTEVYTRFVNTIQQKIVKNINITNPQQTDCSNIRTLARYDNLLGRQNTSYQKLNTTFCLQ